jgi:hypothetical protein
MKRQTANVRNFYGWLMTQIDILCLHSRRLQAIDTNSLWIDEIRQEHDLSWF